MPPIILRNAPSVEDDSWTFTTALPPVKRPEMGLYLSFSHEKISLGSTRFPPNRILQMDDPAKFVLTSFEGFRFPAQPARVAREYMIRFFQAGLVLNGKQYRFYGHSNSQLVTDAVLCT